MKRIIGLMVLLTGIIFTFNFISCDLDGNGDNEGEIKEDIITPPALRAVPIAASNTEPWVIGSYSQGDSNYYLIDVGTISNVYVATILSGNYNGTIPIGLTRTTVNRNIVTQSLTTTISNSVTVTETNSHKVGIEASWKKKFPIGTFSAKAGYEWTGTKSNERSNSMSTSDTYETAQEYIDTITTSFTIGGDGVLPGFYRYALYAICDVYFLIETSLDNQELKDWETIVCAREGNYFEKMDFSAGPVPIFDNSPIGEITFSEDFYKDLPPVGTYIPLPKSDPYMTDAVYVGSGVWGHVPWVGGGHGTNLWRQHIDTVNLKDSFDIDLNEIQQEGFKKIDFLLHVHGSERDNTSSRSQRVGIFSSSFESWSEAQGWIPFGIGGGRTGPWSWNYVVFENIPIDVFKDNLVYIRYASWPDAHTWERGAVIMQLVFHK